MMDTKISLGTVLAVICGVLGVGLAVTAAVVPSLIGLGFLSVGFMLTGHLLVTQRAHYRKESRDMALFDLGRESGLRRVQ